MTLASLMRSSEGVLKHASTCLPMGQVVWLVMAAISSDSLKLCTCRPCFHVLKYLDSLP